MDRNALDADLNQCLEVPKFRDYCPNSRQGEGRVEVRNLVSGVTASPDLLNAAIAARGYLEDAVRPGVDAHVSGEGSEQTVHLARESGVARLPPVTMPWNAMACRPWARIRRSVLAWRTALSTCRIRCQPVRWIVCLNVMI